MDAEYQAFLDEDRFRSLVARVNPSGEVAGNLEQQLEQIRHRVEIEQGDIRTDVLAPTLEEIDAFAMDLVSHLIQFDREFDDQFSRLVGGEIVEVDYDRLRSLTTDYLNSHHIGLSESVQSDGAYYSKVQAPTRLTRVCIALVVHLASGDLRLVTEAQSDGISL